MDIQIIPHPLSGTITPPPSKSIAHRVILAKMLAGMNLDPSLANLSQDIQATQSCAAALMTHGSNLPVMNCSESGSTLRFMIPVSLAIAGGGTFIGKGRLMERPQTPYFDLFAEKGIHYEQTAQSLTVQGSLPSGVYRLPGNVSSQFVTGLLYALPLLDGDSEIRITTPLESRNYVDMTLDVLHRFGIQAENQNYERFLISGNQSYHPQEAELEADWSQAAFWYAANFLDQPIQIQGMNPYSLQGDMIVSDHYWLLARPGDVEIDISDCPDLLPPLAVMAAIRNGTTQFTNAARLRLKESDRLSTVAAMLSALGCHVDEMKDALSVYGQPSLSGGTVDGANDHRIVMAAAIAATACKQPVTIIGAQAVQKSYPSFWKEYQRLGGVIHVL